jgi:hypothetical protein
MKAEQLIKSNSLSNITIDGDQKVVFEEIALTAVNMAKIEAYNQAIEDAAECLYDDEIAPIDNYDYSAGYETVPNEGKLAILKLKK